MIRIDNSVIGSGNPVYIIAELSGNHNKDFDCAAELIRQSARAGADAVKIQTYTPDTITIDCSNPDFRICDGGIWDGRRLYDLYTDAFMPWEWQPELKKIADSVGIPLFSTPFDPSSLDFLEKLRVPAYKIASFEIVDLPLIEQVARTGKPVILSTGMATFDEINEAVQTIRNAGNDQIVLLKCTSAYPAPPDELNLRTIPFLKEKFNTEVGLSDHTLGITAPVAAVSLGASVVEKHVTLSRAKGGVDSAFSLEPDEFRQMVDAIRMTERVLGEVSLEPSAHELQNRIFRRSLYVVKDIRKGDFFSYENIRSIRPGYGLPPKCISSFINRKAGCDIAKGTPLAWPHLETQDEAPDSLS